jgi:integrase
VPIRDYPQFSDKVMSAHTDEELSLLYSHADSEIRFLLDFFLGTAFRASEAMHAEYSDLKGNKIEVRAKALTSVTYTEGFHPKKHHVRVVPIPQALADTLRARQKATGNKLIFPNREGRPSTYLLTMLQDFAVRVGAEFHCELHKLRKTFATRLVLSGVPVTKIQKYLGQQRDVRPEAESPSSLKTETVCPDTLYLGSFSDLPRMRGIGTGRLHHRMRERRPPS